MSENQKPKIELDGNLNKKAANDGQPTSVETAMIGEFFGTFVLVFFGVGSVQDG